MDRLVIRGGRRIEGSVQVRGAKNAVLPQIAAALLSSERLELTNVPDVLDVDTMLALMREFGVTATRGPGRMLVLDASAARNAEAPYDMVRRMRASILVLAPLLARFGTARVSMPGGCAIGARPIDLHLKSLEALGADVNIEAGYINARTNSGGLRGGRIVLSSPSVGASETAIMANLPFALIGGVAAVYMLIPAYRAIEAVARRRGYDPDKPPHLSKVTRTL